MSEPTASDRLAVISSRLGSHRARCGRVALAVALALLACCGNDRSGGSAGDRVAAGVTSHALSDLRDGLRLNDLGKLSVACGMLKAAPLGAADKAEAERGCWVDAPRVLLEAELVKIRVDHSPPELGNMSCEGPSVWTAMAVVQAHPPTDPALARVVAEVRQRCGATVDKRRGDLGW